MYYAQLLMFVFSFFFKYILCLSETYTFLFSQVINKKLYKLKYLLSARGNHTNAAAGDIAEAHVEAAEIGTHDVEQTVRYRGIRAR